MKRAMNRARSAVAETLVAASALLTAVAAWNLLLGMVRHEYLLAALVTAVAALVCQGAARLIDG